MTRTALVAGPTGLVGQQLLQRLLQDPAYAEVRALSRRALPLQHARLRVIQTDYYNLAGLGDALNVDDVFCCLGTTLRKAGSRAAFEDVDYRMVVELARAARAAGARQFLVISAVGASERSPAFYSRVKGRMEAAVSALVRDTAPERSEEGAGAAHPGASRTRLPTQDTVSAPGFDAVHIVRPSLLIGDRGEHRAGEALAQKLAPALNPLLRGTLAKYRAVDGAEVAAALLKLALRGAHGVHVHHLPLPD